MARIHARKRGKSGSKRPVKTDVSFTNLKPKEIEKNIVEWAKEGKSKSVIGLILRDTYAVPSVKKLTGKSISQILEENQVYPKIPEDLDFLIKKMKALKKHLETNTRDVHNKRGLLLLESKIRRMIKYYKRVGKVDKSWSYN